MNIPVWLGERFAGKATLEPPDGAMRPFGAARDAVPAGNGLSLSTGALLPWPLWHMTTGGRRRTRA